MVVFEKRARPTLPGKSDRMQAVDPLSEHIPQLDSMVEAINNGQFSVLNKQYTELDQVFGMLYTTYIDELKYLTATDTANEVAEQIGSMFLEMRPLIKELHDALSLGEFQEALPPLLGLKERAAKLLLLFSDYKETLSQGKKYSEIPYTQELVRVCRHYLKGDLSLEAALGRLDTFCQYHELLEAQISTMRPSSPEKRIFEERLPDLEEALALQQNAVEDLEHALETLEEDAAEESLEALIEAGEVLVEVYRALQKADFEPLTVSCIRCGAENSPESRMCGNCSAVLPQSAALAPSSTITFEEDGSAVGGSDSEEIARLRTLIEQLQLDPDSTDLTDAVARYRLRWKYNQKQFSSLAPPPDDIPAEHRDLLLHSREVFSQAMNTLDEGLSLLEDGTGSLDFSLLAAGLTRMEDGEALFREFAEQFKQAEALSE